jgi:outer membrane receptor protein involved in Fe transport
MLRGRNVRWFAWSALCCSLFLVETSGSAWAQSQTLPALVVTTPKAEPKKKKVVNKPKKPEPIQTESVLPGWFITTVTGAKIDDEFRRVEAASPQVIIDRERFAGYPAGPRANDAIKHLPGVVVSGGIDEAKDIRIRGLDKEFSRVAIDGVQLPDGGEKRELQINRIPSFAIQSMTLVRTPTADLEHDGIAGRLEIKTREIPQVWTTETDAAVGQIDGNGDFAGHFQAMTGGRVGNVGLMVYGSVVEEPREKHKQKLNAAGLVTETEYEDKPLSYQNFGADLAWFYGGGEFHVKPIVALQSEDKDKLKEKFKNGAFDGSETEDEVADKDTYGLTLANVHKVRPGGVLETSGGYYETSEVKDKVKHVFKKDGSENLGGLTLTDEDKTDAFWQGKIAYTQAFDPAEAFKIKVGLDTRFRDREKGKIETVGGKPNTKAKDVYALEEQYLAPYIRSDILLGNLLITPGLRYEYVESETHDGAGNDGSSSIGDPLPSLSARYALSRSWFVRGGYARTVTRPKFDELAPFEQEESSTITLGNPALKPSYAHGYDAGFEYATPALFLGHNVFRRDITDLIETVVIGTKNGKEVQQAQNTGDGWTQGLELEQRINFGELGIGALDGLFITANETFLQSEVQPSEPGSVARRFKDQPRFVGNLIVEYRLPIWQTIIGAAFNYTSALDQIETGAGDDRNAQLIVDLQITQPLDKDIYLYASAQNVTGETLTKTKSNGDVEIEGSSRTFLIGLKSKF